MEINEEDNDIEQLVKNKETGFSRSSPQSEAQKKKEVKTFDCSSCVKRFGKREEMLNHQKNHEINCQTCDKVCENNSKLQEHIWSDHDEMICHMQCEGGKCSRIEPDSPQLPNMQKCNFCSEVFQSRNRLLIHKADTHRSYKPCRDPINCVYQTGCYFSHVPVTDGRVRCYHCGDEFDTLHAMMIHRKTHSSIKECKNNLAGNCVRGDNCWWKHETKEKDFRQVKENLPPPIESMQQTSQKTMQNTPNQMLVNRLNAMETEMKKIRELLYVI